MKRLLQTVSLGLMLLFATTANAVTVLTPLPPSGPAPFLDIEDNGTIWRITIVSDTANNLAAELLATPWYGDAAKADTYASLISGSMTNGPVGPAFAYSLTSSSVNWRIYNSFVPGTIMGGNPSFFPTTFATAENLSAIPLPAAGALLLFGMGSVHVLRRQKRAVSSAHTRAQVTLPR